MDPIIELLADLLDEYASAHRENPEDLPSSYEYAPAVTALHYLLSTLEADKVESLTADEIKALVTYALLTHINEYHGRIV